MEENKGLPLNSNGAIPSSLFPESISSSFFLSFFLSFLSISARNVAQSREKRALEVPMLPAAAWVEAHSLYSDFILIFRFQLLCSTILFCKI
jgi:hypothetical protein